MSMLINQVEPAMQAAITTGEHAAANQAAINATVVRTIEDEAVRNETVAIAVAEQYDRNGGLIPSRAAVGSVLDITA